MEDISLALMTGVDIPIPQCKLVIHQPLIKEIGMIGEQKYFEGAQLLCISKKSIQLEDESVLENTSNFEIFMTVIFDQRMLDKKQSLVQVMSIFFPNYNVTFTPSSIILQKDKDVILIDKNNFDYLQEVVKEILCLGNEKGQQISFNPKGKAAEEIAAKLMRARARVAEEKGAANNSVLGQQVSILAIGLNLLLSDVINMTLYQLLDQIERYQLYVSWDIDIRARLAGAEAKKELEDWMKPIH